MTVTSDADPAGETVTLTEDANTAGIFSGLFGFEVSGEVRLAKDVDPVFVIVGDEEGNHYYVESNGNGMAGGPEIGGQYAGGFGR